MTDETLRTVHWTAWRWTTWSRRTMLQWIVERLTLGWYLLELGKQVDFQAVTSPYGQGHYRMFGASASYQVAFASPLES